MGDCDSLVLGGVVLLAFIFIMNNQNFSQNHQNRRRRRRRVQYEYLDNKNDEVDRSQKVQNPEVPVRSEKFGKNELPATLHTAKVSSSCNPQRILTAKDLLPSSEDGASIDSFNQDYPIGEGILRSINFLEAGYHTGINTVGQSLRNSNKQLRSEPPNPQVSVSPWMNTTIAPDLIRRPLDVTDSCSLMNNDVKK